jgi:serine/threonine protein kinase
VHNSGDSKADDEKALGRLRRELDALGQVGFHPALITIVDSNIDERWFVMDFHPGVLSKCLRRSEGDLLTSLIALRPVVEAVAKVHEKGFVHRDINPQNIFVSAEDRLVLGDFGLVIDDQSGRLTDTYENVGTRDWMPGWASGIRLDDVRASFDVFSLGKVLWNMISGKQKLQLWYHRKSQFDLETIFPDDPMMAEANLLLDECVVEEEDKCLPNAGELLRRIDSIIHTVKLGGQILAEGRIECIICRKANYVEQSAGNYEKYLLCPFCGNVQKFNLERKPRGWGGSP